MIKINFDEPVHVHFIGIGGISMSGLAEILLKRGFKITGSDSKESELTTHLVSLGAKIAYPQAADNITSDVPDLIVYTAAVHEGNPEFDAAVASGKPMLSRAELLGQIMDQYARSIAVSGTHGKTTTTSMISQILLAGTEDPTISVGGILEAIGSNIHVGDSDLFITESCEYTNSFHSFFPRYNIILNVEADHLDFFKNLENYRASFKTYAKNTAEDGILIINSEIDDLEYFTEGLKCQVITYGFDDKSDIYPLNVTYENGCGRFEVSYKGKTYGPFALSVPGKHNVSNALSAIVLCLNMDISSEQIAAGLLAFGGADRRFQYKGMYKGATIIDDYAHHPTEISASLAAAANYPKNRLIVCFQPHTYTRTLSFLEDFAKALSAADVVLLADIYPAREPDIYGVSSKDIVDRMEKYPCEAHYIGSFEDCEKFLSNFLMNNDLLITMGAGDVYLVGEHLLNS